MNAPAVLSYLVRYGWLTHELLSKPEAVAQAVSRLKTFFGLDDPDPFAMTEGLETLVARPRCGNPDFQMARGSSAKWNVLDLKVHCGIGAIGGLSEQEVKDCLWRACESWQAVCGLRFDLVEKREAANIWTAPKSLPGPTLAWSYLPDASRNPPEQIEQRYDTTVKWQQQGAEYLQGVMAHELGHAIGLDHGRRGSLMQPFAEEGLFTPREGDIAEVVERYGKPRPKDPVPPTTNPGTPGGEIVVTTGVRIPAGRYTVVLRPE